MFVPHFRFQFRCPSLDSGFTRYFCDWREAIVAGTKNIIQIVRCSSKYARKWPSIYCTNPISGFFIQLWHVLYYLWKKQTPGDAQCGFTNASNNMIMKKQTIRFTQYFFRVSRGEKWITAQKNKSGKLFSLTKFEYQRFHTNTADCNNLIEKL